jgi:hypothetical protein
MATAETVGGDLVVLAVAWPWCRCASPRVTLVELGHCPHRGELLAAAATLTRQDSDAGDGSE